MKNMMNDSQLLKLQKAHQYAISRGGECLSLEYTTSKEKMLWKCNQSDHPQWLSTYDNCINKKSWCMLCSGKAKPTTEEGLKKSQQYAHKHNGKCLSEHYETVNKKVKLEWKCHNIEHPSWFGTVDNVIHKNTWCSLCGFEAQQQSRKDNQGLEKCQEYAKSLGGKLISTEYVNQNTNLEWKCNNEQHSSWFALPKIVNRGTWCSRCSREKKEKSSHKSS